MIDLLKEIQRGIYNKTLEEEDVLDAIGRAKSDIQADLEKCCEHSFVGVNGGYYYEKCSKCWKLK